MPSIKILDSTMYYEDLGKGAPYIFLHGNPSSSYVWRHIMPHLAQSGHCLAPDLIGMGRSGKPQIAYRFTDHAQYLETWFDALDLNSVVLIGHDWGGALAFDWAARHPKRVRGIAFFETIVRPMTWSDFPGPARARIETLRAAGSGETKVLQENFFMNVALRSTTRRGLSATELEVYQTPYPTPESRRPLLAWPRAFPIEGEPRDVHQRVEAYDRWLATSNDVPKLLLTFDGAPETLIMNAEVAAWCTANIAQLETIPCGSAGHLAQEDQPEAITVAIAGWLKRNHLG